VAKISLLQHFVFLKTDGMITVSGLEVTDIY